MAWEAVSIANVPLSDVRILRFKRREDQRGYFSEVYKKKTFEMEGMEIDFVQDNHSFSAHKGTVRGLHFQAPPVAQHKLVRVIRGAVFDIAVDLRRSSASYGRHVSVVLSAAARNQILVPIGFAHGLMTLEDDTDVVYKVSNYYSSDHDKGLLWNDPALNIRWPLPVKEALLSDRDRGHPTLAEFESPFA